MLSTITVFFPSRSLPDYQPFPVSFNTGHSCRTTALWSKRAGIHSRPMPRWMGVRRCDIGDTADILLSLPSLFQHLQRL